MIHPLPTLLWGLILTVSLSSLPAQAFDRFDSEGDGPPSPTSAPTDVPPEVPSPQPEVSGSAVPTAKPIRTPRPPSPTAEATPTAIPTATPSVTPKPTPTPTTVPIPVGNRPALSYTINDATEGKTSILNLRLENSAYLSQTLFPIKGTVSYEDTAYHLSGKLSRKVPFVISNSGSTAVPLVFQSPGKKVLKIETESKEIAPRNVSLSAKPFPATVFPVTVDTRAFTRNASDWRVYVNLQVSQQAGALQRQHYTVVFRDQIVQRLLTSSATPDKVTPLGKFKLGPKLEAPKSTLYESVMPFWTTILVPGFSMEYGNHGLEGDSYLYYLGLPASHGCLRLSNKVVRQGNGYTNIGGAKWVFTYVPIGTQIEIFKRPLQPFVHQSYSSWLKAR